MPNSENITNQLLNQFLAKAHALEMITTRLSETMNIQSKSFERLALSNDNLRNKIESTTNDFFEHKGKFLVLENNIKTLSGKIINHINTHWQWIAVLLGIITIWTLIDKFMK